MKGLYKKTVGRFLCWLFGCPACPMVGTYPDGGVVIYCPRCWLIWNGKEHVDRWRAKRAKG